jgi:acetyltransferase-like isoleucine patch superfamily enzyme
MSGVGERIEDFVNTAGEPAFALPGARIGPGARIVDSRLLGPLSLGPRTQLGPDVVAGKYLGVNTDSYIARASIGAFCAFGSRVSVNPLNHPTGWLSIHEFQYHQNSFFWDEAYRSVSKLPHVGAKNNPRIAIGNDVWIGHNATVLEGVTIGDGAVIGVGAVVTADIPPYAIAVGIPARVKRYRFEPDIIDSLVALRWWELDLTDLRNVTFDKVEVAIGEIETIRAKRGAASTSA